MVWGVLERPFEVQLNYLSSLGFLRGGQEWVWAFPLAKNELSVTV